MHSMKHLFSLAALSAMGKQAGGLPVQLPEIPRLLGAFDLELLYVECSRCNRPILWDQGKTTSILQSAGIDLSLLDAQCLILADGCPACQSVDDDGYVLSVVRVSDVTPEEALYLGRPAGSA